MTKRILIIDGDSICFRAAAASESRTVICKHLPSGREKEFPTRTALKRSLEQKQFEYKEEDWEFIDLQHPEPESHTNFLVQSQIEKMVHQLEPDEIEVYLGSGTNFRNMLALPSPYKGSRGESIRPVNLLKARSHAVSKYNAFDISHTFLETDDVITIRAYEEKAAGNFPYLASIDKDSQQSNGITLVNWTKEPMLIEEAPLIGTLYKDKNGTVKGKGLMFLCYQAIAGDPTDSYQGYELSEVKYGPTKAMNELLKAQTVDDLYAILQQEYQKLYPKPVEYVTWNGLHAQATWEELLAMYWQCAYMKRSWSDPSDYKLFFSELGVKV